MGREGARPRGERRIKSMNPKLAPGRLWLVAAFLVLTPLAGGGCIKEERGSGTSMRASAIVPRTGGMTRGDGRGMIGDRY